MNKNYIIIPQLYRALDALDHFYVSGHELSPVKHILLKKLHGSVQFTRDEKCSALSRIILIVSKLYLHIVVEDAKGPEFLSVPLHLSHVTVYVEDIGNVTANKSGWPFCIFM